MPGQLCLYPCLPHGLKSVQPCSCSSELGKVHSMPVFLSSFDFCCYSGSSLLCLGAPFCWQDSNPIALIAVL